MVGHMHSTETEVMTLLEEIMTYWQAKKLCLGTNQIAQKVTTYRKMRIKEGTYKNQGLIFEQSYMHSNHIFNDLMRLVINHYPPSTTQPPKKQKKVSLYSLYYTKKWERSLIS